VHLIERAGVLVFALPVRVEGLDAFSMWAGEEHRRPVIVASHQPAGDRLRFSVAHELGHLVMHAPINGMVQQLEREADAFAASFLMPEEGIRRDIVPPVTLTALAALKPRWRVAISALVRRSRDLRIVSETQYRYLMKQLSARGWRTEEPPGLAVAPEKPRAFRKMAEVLYHPGAEAEGLAGASGILPQTARDILAAHAELAELTVGAPPRPSAARIVSIGDSATNGASTWSSTSDPQHHQE
ncbi:MAG: ImmA/IrrE family metallo-endopeptidase, partial [Chloroflexota bacterium]|nr:ImmA/IrrE family metallo-endopeptidase [Chloroflexota bacterium]